MQARYNLLLLLMDKELVTVVKQSNTVVSGAIGTGVLGFLLGQRFHVEERGFHVVRWILMEVSERWFHVDSRLCVAGKCDVCLREMRCMLALGCTKSRFSAQPKKSVLRASAGTTASIVPCPNGVPIPG